MGDVGFVASLIHRIIDLVVDEDQLPEILKQREGNRLSKAFQDAHREWRRFPTADSKRKRDEALAALTRWADAP